MNPPQAHREAERLNYLLAKVGYEDGLGTQWWNSVAHPELDGRTALEAWQAGDHEEEVTRLADAFIAERFDEKLRPNEALLARLEGAPSLESLWHRPSVREELTEHRRQQGA